MNQSMQVLLSHSNLNRLKTQIALQCAPVLLGIKISNILIVEDHYKNAVKCIFQNTQLSYYQLYGIDMRTAFLIFDRQSLMQYLKKKTVRGMLRQLGYQTYDLAGILREFVKRCGCYMKTKQQFPHEMGLFLGYPPEDVSGFILHKGKDYLYSGYWKVYGNVDHAIQVFQRYEKAKELVLTWVIRGGTIREILIIKNKKHRFVKT